MQSNKNILNRQVVTFANTGSGRFWNFQNTDNQYRYNHKITSNSTGKELDAETGYSYFGARYLDHTLTTAWLSVDPMVDKYPSISPYAYCAWNPLISKDPNGMDSIHTPNGSLVNVGEGYKASPDGMYLFGDGLSTLKWNPYKKIGGVDPSGMGGYEKCESLNTSGFTIGLDAITNINSFDNVVGIGSDGCFWYKRSKKTNVLTSGTSSNRVVPISKSFIGKSISHSANLITIGFSIEEVSTSIHENGMDSPETYMAIGGLAGNGISIWLCTTTGATAGSTFFGLGAIPGAVLGFFSGVLTNYFLEKGGRMIGKRYYEARH